MNYDKKTALLCIDNDIEQIIYLLYQLFPQFEKVIDNYFSNEEISKETFEKILSDENENKVASIVFVKTLIDKLFQSCDKLTIIIENNYIDRTYRDCYYTHFSGKHFEYSRYCKRILVFSENQIESVKNLDKEILSENFIGSIVIKPIKHGAIGRTLLSPKFIINNNTDKYFVRTAKYNVHYFGLNLEVEAFPFSMQDKETLSCAEVTILNIMDYYSNNYPEYNYALPSDIYQVLKDNGYERPLPTLGMSYTMISKVLYNFGFFPKLYIANEGYTDEQLKRILSYYVESAIPVAVGIHHKDGYNHSIVCIGHGNTDNQLMLNDLYRTFEVDSFDDTIDDIENLYIADSANSHNEFIVMDDNIMPYSTYCFCEKEKSIFSIKNNGYSFGRKNHCDIDKSSSILCIAVPLYKRMYMDAENARYICIEILKDRGISFKKSCQDSLSLDEIGTETSPIVTRLFLASSKTFLMERINHLPKSHILNKLYKSTHFPKFVWVCELFDKKSYNDNLVLGEIVLDATSSISDNPFDSVISIFYPNTCCTRTFDGSTSKEFLNIFPNKKESDNQGIEIEFIVKDNDNIENFKPFKMFNGNLSCIG